MDQITHLRLAGNDGVDGGSCRPGGCAGLCTEAGLRAADTAHRSRMLARARRVLADPELAEEAVQEALLRAWRSCSTFDPAGGPLLPWLLALTRNTAIDLARWRGRRPPVSAQADPTDAPVRSEAIGAEELTVLRDELVDALAELGPVHRSVIVETVLRGRPHAEVAAELGIPSGTVRSRVHYGLRHLRTQLETGYACA